MTDWPFADPPDVAVLTTCAIVEGRAPVLRVTHDEDDGAWQFHDGNRAPPHEADARIVSLRSMIERDASLSSLADLPLGWTATRNDPDRPWDRQPALPGG